MRYRRVLEGPDGTTRILAGARRTVAGPLIFGGFCSLNPRFMRNGLLMLVLVMGVSALLYTWLGASSTIDTKPYSGPGSFLEQVEQGNVGKVIQSGETLSVFNKPVDEKDTEPDYVVSIANVLVSVRQDIGDAAAKGSVLEPTLDTKPAPDNSWIGLVLTGLLPLLIIGGFIYFMMRQAQGTNNQALSFGKS